MKDKPVIFGDVNKAITVLPPDYTFNETGISFNDDIEFGVLHISSNKIPVLSFVDVTEKQVNNPGYVYNSPIQYNEDTGYGGLYGKESFSPMIEFGNHDISFRGIYDFIVPLEFVDITERLLSDQGYAYNSAIQYNEDTGYGGIHGKSDKAPVIF